MSMGSIFKNKKNVFGSSKAYYIVLSVCVIGVGITAAAITTLNLQKARLGSEMDRLISEEEIDQSSVSNSNTDDLIIEVPSKAEEASKIETAASKEADKADAAKPDKKASLSASNQKKDTTASSGEKNTVSNKIAGKSAKFLKPVFGNIVLGFAVDTLVFSDTLEEWTIHSGIDIASQRGTQVKAAADGVVSEIKNDPRYGVTIILEHADGFKTVYANLASADMVQPNQKVKQGEVIGGVGNTAAFESVTEPHLHFEVLKNGEPIDPTKYL